MYTVHLISKNNKYLARGILQMMMFPAWKWSKFRFKRSMASWVFSGHRTTKKSSWQDSCVTSRYFMAPHQHPSAGLSESISRCAVKAFTHVGSTNVYVSKFMWCSKPCRRWEYQAENPSVLAPSSPLPAATCTHESVNVYINESVVLNLDNVFAIFCLIVFLRFPVCAGKLSSATNGVPQDS